MSNFTFVKLAAGTAAILACCAGPVHADGTLMRLAADQLNQEQFEQKLQDTRTDIRKQQTTTRPGDNANSNQLAVDICKKNPRLPQCKPR